METAQTADGATLSTGSRVFGRYQIVRCISSGGMGAVYEVIHLETRRRCALKVMLPSIVSNPDLRARFQLEATVTADIQSEHIVELFDAGVDGESGTPFIVMELLRGEDLQSMIFRRGALTPPEVITLLYQAAMALDRTHGAGIVHRDLKPENLFVTTRDDGSPRLKIFDFGIAKVVAGSAAVSKATQGMGTPMYMAPEQRGGDGTIGPPADTYALGHIAYCLLVGEPYWEEEASGAPTVYAFLMKMAAGIVEAPSARALRRRDRSLSPAFDAWLMKAASPRPEERFQRASELVVALASALEQPIPSASGPSLIIPVQPPSAVNVSAPTIATDPGALAPPEDIARSSTPAVGITEPTVKRASAPPIPAQVPAEPMKSPNARTFAIIGGAIVGLLIAGILYRAMGPGGSSTEAPKPPMSSIMSTAAAIDPALRASSSITAISAPNSSGAAEVPSVTPASVAPSASVDAAPPSTKPTVAAPASARPTSKPSDKTPVEKPTGKVANPPVDPLDVR